MKNHLSMELSIFSGGRSSLGGSGGSLDRSCRLGEWATVMLALETSQTMATRGAEQAVTYMETPLGWVLPVMRRSQASAHSRTTSMA